MVEYTETVGVFGQIRLGRVVPELATNELVDVRMDELCKWRCYRRNSKIFEFGEKMQVRSGIRDSIGNKCSSLIFVFVFDK
jgi:hypothetical protein